VANLIRDQLGVAVNIERGGFGEFTVLAEEQVVIKRTTITLPKDEEVLAAVRSHLNPHA
jgi:hypothetical protein